MNTTTTKVGTNRGRKRIWLQGLSRYGWTPGEHVSITEDFNAGELVIKRDANSRRKISAPSKGGVLDITLNSVTELWEQHGRPERVAVTLDADIIRITFAEEVSP